MRTTFYFNFPNFSKIEIQVRSIQGKIKNLKFPKENAFLFKDLCYTISIKYNTKMRGAFNGYKYCN